MAACLGEVILPERAFLDGLILWGAMRAVLLVENLGAWRDMPRPPGWLLAHVPGWETTTARLLLEVCRGTPVLHFGDLDPNGVRIFGHLRRYVPDLRWFLPAFWFDADAAVRVRKGGPVSGPGVCARSGAGAGRPGAMDGAGTAGYGPASSGGPGGAAAGAPTAGSRVPPGLG